MQRGWPGGGVLLTASSQRAPRPARTGRRTGARHERGRSPGQHHRVGRPTHGRGAKCPGGLHPTGVAGRPARLRGPGRDPRRAAAPPACGFRDPSGQHGERTRGRRPRAGGQRPAGRSARIPAALAPRIRRGRWRARPPHLGPRPEPAHPGPCSTVPVRRRRRAARRAGRTDPLEHRRPAGAGPPRAPQLHQPASPGLAARGLPDDRRAPAGARPQPADRPPGHDRHPGQCSGRRRRRRSRGADPAAADRLRADRHRLGGTHCCDARTDHAGRVAPGLPGRPGRAGTCSQSRHALLGDGSGGGLAREAAAGLRPRPGGGAAVPAGHRVARAGGAAPPGRSHARGARARRPRRAHP